MIDSLFSAALTFCILVGGTVAIGSAMLDHTPAAPVVQQAIKPPAASASRMVATSQNLEASRSALR